MRHPASLLAAGVAFLCIAVTVSFQLWETDFWQHLVVGKAIWQQGEVPTTHLWSWPTYGARDVNASWGFRALIWPVWQLGGVWGLYIWRWIMTLAAFAILYATSRRLGAKGLLPFFVMVVCALTWRYRANIRPETLVGVLLALQIWILETRRFGGKDRSFWLVPLAWVWANVHISYPLGFVMIGIHLVNDVVPFRRNNSTGKSRRDTRRLLLVTVAALAVSFANPWGWRAVWQPFEYFFFWRHEVILQTISELLPLHRVWVDKMTTGLPILLLLWPLLIVGRIRHQKIDLVELLVCLLYTTLALSSVRFAGFYALTAIPYVARDLDEWIHARRWPKWSARPFARAGLVAVLSVLVCLPEWRQSDLPIRVGLDERRFPEHACDFMLAHDVGGRGFNQFYLGGYMLWRFWPERERLPFMDIHGSGTREDRYRYTRVFTESNGWSEADAFYHFDYALLDASQDPRTGDYSRDRLDADTSFVLVFCDDAATLYVKRAGRFAELAERFGYRYVPGGIKTLGTLGSACLKNASIRPAVRRELERRIKSSPWNSRALSFLANIDLVESRYDDARTRLEQALAVDPRTSIAHERLGLIALMQNRPLDAVRELELARKSGRGTRWLDQRLAQAYEAVGDFRKARKYYRRALELAPGNAALQDSLRRLESQLGN